MWMGKWAILIKFACRIRVQDISRKQMQHFHCFKFAKDQEDTTYFSAYIFVLFDELIGSFFTMMVSLGKLEARKKRRTRSFPPIVKINDIRHLDRSEGIDSTRGVRARFSEWRGNRSLWVCFSRRVTSLCSQRWKRSMSEYGNETIMN